MNYLDKTNFNLINQTKLHFFSLRSILLFLVGVYTAFQFQINLFRLAGSDFFSSVPLYFLFLLFFVSFFVFFSERMRVDSGCGFLTFYFVFIFYGLLLGLLNNGMDALYSLRYFILPILGLLLVSRSELFINSIVTNRSLWIAVLLLHVIGYAYYFIFLKGAVYPGVGVPSVAFSFFYFFFLKKFFLALISFTLIVLEGKRSILLSVLIVLSFVYVARTSGIRRLFLLFSLSCLMLLMMYAISDIESSSIINRINMINPFSSSFDIMIGSSGRMGEFYSYFSDKDLISVIFGSGLGFSYVWDLGYESGQNDQVKGYFHFSYANYVAVAGFLGLLLSVILFKGLSFIKNEWPNSDILRAFCFFSLVQACFGFNLSGDILTWGFILLPWAYRHFLNKCNKL